MRTEDLIDALVADLTASRAPFRWILLAGVALGSIIAAVEFLFWIGVRPDIGHAIETVRFLFKFVVTLCLAATAARLLSRLATPGVSTGFWAWAWLAAPMLLMVAVAAELIVTPETAWWSRLVGTNARFCVMLIPFLSIGPLGVHIGGLATGRADEARPHRRRRRTRGERHSGDALCVPLHR